MSSFKQHFVLLEHRQATANELEVLKDKLLEFAAIEAMLVLPGQRIVLQTMTTSSEILGKITGLIMEIQEVMSVVLTTECELILRPTDPSYKRVDEQYILEGSKM